MRAAVFHGARDIRIESVPEPGRPASGEVLLRPYWCGICGTDLHEYTAGPIVIPTKPHPLTSAQAPQILGHEFSAEVLAVADDVTNVSAGQRVAVMPNPDLRPLLFLPTWSRTFVPHDGLCGSQLRVGGHRGACHRSGRKRPRDPG